MATIYFTSNADSGDGTLREAITNANAGDVIQPDPVAFANSGDITILLSSGLPLNSVSIVGSTTQRIILDRQANGYFYRITSSGQTLSFENVDFANGRRTTSNESPFYIGSANTSVSFINCRFYDNVGAYSGFLRGVTAATGATLTFRNCVAWNNSFTNSTYTADFFTFQSGANADISVIGCTFDCPNIPFLNPNAVVKTDSLLGGSNDWNIDFSTVGFVDRSANDYRLAPGSAYLTGGTLAGSDILGHARTGSIGAFDGSWIVATGSATVSANQTVDWLDLGASAVLTLDGQDRILTVARGVYSVATGASVVSATNGFVVAPSADALANATLTNVVCAVAGAGASNLAATTTGISWSATDSTVSVVLQLQSGSTWTTIAQTAGTSYSTTLAGGSVVRLFDGVNFLTATVPVPPGPTPTDFDFHAWGVYDATITVDVGVPFLTTTQTAAVYKVATDFILMSQYFNRGETPVLFARIQNSETGQIISPSAVSSIVYTAYSKTVGWGSETRTPVEGHVAETVPNSAVLSALVPPTDDSRWTVDSTGYNFIFEPDSTVNPIFPNAGDYVVVVTINFTNANPLPISFDVSCN